ncbi:hypothetical protein Acor_62240 [Acrocarpospora corrugata]|uniref:Mycothiol-dependent maleylpyruvate isomerase metal-binding domain-containing protein n=1 Tax=Acrocarpospora corrugata TaxID=35763 RepID=A0A5M3W515_9ACTN|nr:maleylpyruvate isomerase family mycothiol-dependent enzyme [Acrocarpospora corrugata]GES04157.1 hypothetical protein Acor_62240 [Acrocarpospora corrugata]
MSKNVPDELPFWIRAEWLSLADFLDGLDDHEWQVASLCPGWTVHDVVAHLTTSTRTTLLMTIKDAIRARGDFHRMTADQARERAASFGPAELIAQLRESADSTNRSPGSGPWDPLIDLLAHGQDIARPLGLVREMPGDAAIATLDHVRNRRFYGGPKRFRGTKLIATDVNWSAGEGPDEVRGPVADLLLLATGRPAALAALSGSGTKRIAATL